MPLPPVRRLAGAYLGVDVPLVGNPVAPVGSPVAFVGYMVAPVGLPVALRRFGIGLSLAFSFLGFPPILADVALIGYALARIDESLPHLVVDLALVGSPVALVGNMVAPRLLDRL